MLIHSLEKYNRTKRAGSPSPSCKGWYSVSCLLLLGGCLRRPGVPPGGGVTFWPCPKSHQKCAFNTRGRTHFVPFGHSVRTTAASQCLPKRNVRHVALLVPNHLATSRDVGALVLCGLLTAARSFSRKKEQWAFAAQPNCESVQARAKRRAAHTSSKPISGGCLSGVTKERSEFRRMTSKRVFDYFLRASKK